MPITRFFFAVVLFQGCAAVPPADDSLAFDRPPEASIATNGVNSLATAVASVSAGMSPCAVLNNGEVKCWGRGEDGALGRGDYGAVGYQPGEMGSRLQAVALGQRALSVTTSQDYPGAFACALLADRQVKCWGSNARGQLGLGDTVTRPAPADDTIDFGPGRSVLKVSAGARHACAVLDDGQIACWGDNVTAFVGVLGYGAAEPFLPAPTRRVPLAAGRTAVDVEAGNFSTCALLDDGTVTCWGFNNWGQLGYGDTVGRATPGAPLNFGGARIASISSGYDTRCAVTADGALRCWGRSGTGLLGSNDPNRATSPLARAAFDFGGRRVVEASAGLTICVRLDNGEVRCFGRNGAGQAGIGTTQPVLATQSSPIELGRGRSSVSISSREGFSLGSAVCAILDDGTLHCWGGNAQGQLGLGDAINRGTAPQNLPSTYPATKLW